MSRDADRRVMHAQVIAGSSVRVEAPGYILFASCGYLGVGPEAQVVINFWYEGSMNGPAGPLRTFKAFATGERLPSQDHAVYCRSAMDPDGRRAWHLYELFND